MIKLAAHSHPICKPGRHCDSPCRPLIRHAERCRCAADLRPRIGCLQSVRNRPHAPWPRCRAERVLRTAANRIDLRHTSTHGAAATCQLGKTARGSSQNARDTGSFDRRYQYAAISVISHPRQPPVANVAAANHRQEASRIIRVIPCTLRAE